MFTKLFRIGNEPEIKYIPSGKAVAELSLAYDVGYGQNKKTQWIKAALWEKKAEALIPYLHKGDQLHAVLDDVHIETYPKQDGTEGFNLKARVIDVSLVSNGSPSNGNDRPQSGNEPQQQAPSQPDQQQTGSFDDDIPF